MTAWAVSNGRLKRIDRDPGEPGPGQILVRVSCCGVCRTDLHLAEGDLPARAARRDSRARGGRDRRQPRAREPRGSRSVSGSASRGWRATDGTCRFCRRGDENLCLAPSFTGWDRRRRVRGRLPGRRGVRLRAARRPGRRAGRAAALRRDHRLPRAAARRRARRRPARHLRLRRQRAPDRAGRAGAGTAGARPDPRRAQPRAWPASWAPTRSVGRRTARRSRWTARSCSPRPASSCRSRSGALDRGGTLAVAGIWLSDIPGAELRRRAVPGAGAAQRHGEHPHGRRGVPRLWPSDSAYAPRPCLSDGGGAARAGRPRARPVQRRRRLDQLTALGGGRQQVTRPATQITEIDPACFCGRGQP